VRIRGALHLHSTFSQDGTLTVAELGRFYVGEVSSSSSSVNAPRTWMQRRSGSLWSRVLRRRMRDCSLCPASSSRAALRACTSLAWERGVWRPMPTLIAARIICEHGEVRGSGTPGAFRVVTCG
jgi:hypothetical protein